MNRGTYESGHGTSQVEPGVGQTGHGTSQTERDTDHADHSTSQAEQRTARTDRSTDRTGHEISSHADHGTSGHPGHGSSGHPGHGTDYAARGRTGQFRRGADEAERAAIPAQSPALTPPLQVTAPAESMPTPPAPQEALSAAAPAGSRPDTTIAGRPDAPAAGPKAVKVITRKKLTYARVLLSQRIAEPSGSPAGTYATKAGRAVAFARAQLGKPCVWGAAGPGSYDCAGLTQAAWKSAGVTLPRTAPEQAGVGIPVPPAEARAGDLVFFHDDADHVGLCTGDGMMIHAPRPGAYVREEPVSALGEATVHSAVRPG
ncbi:C40 family peptidase [Streptomyces nogalater]|uniref:C40 family peptidase n=2 Tax=Streptomyces nogalater TaxID=38314 RepID=A0ABW0WQ90_STRNO